LEKEQQNHNKFVLCQLCFDKFEKKISDFRSKKLSFSFLKEWNIKFIFYHFFFLHQIFFCTLFFDFVKKVPASLAEERWGQWLGMHPLRGCRQSPSPDPNPSQKKSIGYGMGKAPFFSSKKMKQPSQKKPDEFALKKTKKSR
jgi:hypothetical protein